MTIEHVLSVSARIAGKLHFVSASIWRRTLSIVGHGVTGLRYSRGSTAFMSKGKLALWSALKQSDSHLKKRRKCLGAQTGRRWRKQRQSDPPLRTLTLRSARRPSVRHSFKPPRPLTLSPSSHSSRQIPGLAPYLRAIFTDFLYRYGSSKRTHPDIVRPSTLPSKYILYRLQAGPGTSETNTRQYPSDTPLDSTSWRPTWNPLMKSRSYQKTATMIANNLASFFKRRLNKRRITMSLTGMGQTIPRIRGTGRRGNA